LAVRRSRLLWEFPRLFPHVTLTELNSDSHLLAGEVRYRVNHQPCFG
jgi:hypothetical protein